MSEIHFEVFHAQGRAGGWSLVEALPDRNAALERAKQLIAAGSTAVKVVKETLKPETGDYMSLTIFEEGKVEVKKQNKKVDDDINTVPCFKPDDLYSYHARMTMARLLGEWLARQRLTVTELIHSAQALEKFEATGTTYQHAIQKVAVASASDTDVPVSQLVKQLMELCTSAIHRVYKDERRGVFPVLAEGKFAPLAEKIAKNADASYVLNGSLTKYLAPAKSWEAKLKRLLLLMDELPAEGPGRTLLLNSIDTIVAEMLNGAAALADLLGPNPDLGHALFNLVQLFLGAPTDGEGGDGGINSLAQHFAKDDLPNARAAIANRILSELRGLKRLCPDSLDDELKMLRRLANHLVRGQGKYLSNEDLIGAFIDRSKRLVTHEPLAQFMATAKTGDEKVERLLIIEENLIGVENKRTLCSFIMPIIGANSFEDQLCAGGSPVQRLKRAKELQERVLRSGFQDIEKTRIASALDAVALRIEKRTGLLASLETRLPNPVERAQAILKLCTANIFTQGDLFTKARQHLLSALSKPGFLTGYVTQIEREKKSAVDRNEVLTELVGRLEQAGIAPDEGLRALAA